MNEEMCQGGSAPDTEGDGGRPGFRATVEVSLESSPSKPDPSDMWRWQARDAFEAREVGVSELACLLGSGHACRAGLFSGDSPSYRKADAVSSQVVALDFDDCASDPWEVCAYAESVGMPANFFYATYSQDEGSWEALAEDRRVLGAGALVPASRRVERGAAGWRFRVVWVLERPVSPREYEAAVRVLAESTFAGFHPDRATKDVSRLWLGGRLGSVVLSEEPLPLSCVGWASVVERMARNGGDARAAARLGNAFVSDYRKIERPRVEVGPRWWEPLRGKCELWDMYEEGLYLDYNQRVRLFANTGCLARRDGSGSIVEDLMGFYRPEVWAGHTFDRGQLIRIMSSRSLRPLPCVRAYGERMTVPQFLSLGRSSVAPAADLVPLSDLDAWMDGQVPALLDAAGSCYIKCETGSGKTERVLRYLADGRGGGKIVYAAPQYSNLREFSERLGAYGASARVIPPLVLTDADRVLLSLGLPRESRDHDRDAFMMDLLNSETEGIYAVTHSLLSRISDIPGACLAIVDEGPEESLVRTCSLSLAELERAAENMDSPARRAMLAFVKEAAGASPGDVLDASGIAWAVDALAESVRRRVRDGGDVPPWIPAGLFPLMQGKIRRGYGDRVVSCSVSPFVSGAMARGARVKVLSATPKPRLLADGCGVELPVYEAPRARKVGRVVQHRGVSGAKGRGMSKVRGLAEYAAESLARDGLPAGAVISFKGSEAVWEEKGFRPRRLPDGRVVHLGNNAGLDCLRGVPLTVAGKYDMPMEAWEDRAALMGITDAGSQNRVFERDGVSQPEYLLRDDRLRGEQVEFLDAVASQAVGRARALREPVEVHYFGNHLIPGADEIVD